MKKRNMKFSNRLNYTLLAIFILVLGAVVVYAAVPNPGHEASAIEPPSGCSSGEILSWTGTAWDCVVDDAGSSGISGLEVVTNTGACRGVNNLVATCPSGKRVIGGGCNVDTSDPLIESYPYFTSGQYMAWRCSAQNSGTSCIAYAICADA